MATFVIDFFKGTLATLLPIMFHLQGVSPLIFGLLAVIGHTFLSLQDLWRHRLSQPVLEWFSDLRLSSVSTLQLFSLEPSILGSMISLSSVTASIAAVIGVLLFPLLDLS